jgi:hypothetical protein
MIDIEKFTVKKEQRIPVMLPSKKGKAFRVDKDDVIENVLLTYNQAKKSWYFVSPELAEEHEISPIYISDIYHAVTNKNEDFLIPVTRGWNGKHTDFSESLTEMIEASFNQWVTRTGVENEIHQYETIKLNKKPQFKKTMEECLESAFNNRLIEKTSDLKKSVRIVEEDD